MNIVFKFLFIGIFIAGMSACSEKKSTPKPRGYCRMDLPQERNYTVFSARNYPYSFEVHGNAEVIPDANLNSEPYWVDVYYPDYNAKIHISYKNLKKNSISQLIEDTHYMVYKHTVKADAITEQGFENEKNTTSGFLYDIGGNAASNLQFYLTDHKNHFLRGALYFDTQPNRDSLEPVILYISEDIRHLIETTRWK